MEGRERTTAEIAIAELRERVLDLKSEYVEVGSEMIMDDLYLLRWLKARDMDPAKAERMLRRSLKWRNELLLKYTRDVKLNPELLELFTYEQRFTRNGEIVYFLNPYIHLRRLLEKYGVEDPYVCGGKLLADSEELSIKWNRENFEKQNSDVITEDSMRGHTVVVDCKYATASQIASFKCFQFCKLIATDYLKNVPTLGSLVIMINCSKLAIKTANFFKPLYLPAYATVRMFGHNEEKWKAALLELIHPDELPIQYGGNLRNRFEVGKVRP